MLNLLMINTNMEVLIMILLNKLSLPMQLPRFPGVIKLTDLIIIEVRNRHECSMLYIYQGRFPRWGGFIASSILRLSPWRYKVKSSPWKGNKSYPTTCDNVF